MELTSPPYTGTRSMSRNNPYLNKESKMTETVGIQTRSSSRHIFKKKSIVAKEGKPKKDNASQRVVKKNVVKQEITKRPARKGSVVLANQNKKNVRAILPKCRSSSTRDKRVPFKLLFPDIDEEPISRTREDYKIYPEKSKAKRKLPNTKENKVPCLQTKNRRGCKEKTKNKKATASKGKRKPRKKRSVTPEPSQYIVRKAKRLCVRKYAEGQVPFSHQPDSRRDFYKKVAAASLKVKPEQKENLLTGIPLDAQPVEHVVTSSGKILKSGVNTAEFLDEIAGEIPQALRRACNRKVPRQRKQSKPKHLDEFFEPYDPELLVRRSQNEEDEESRSFLNWFLSIPYQRQSIWDGSAPMQS